MKHEFHAQYAFALQDSTTQAFALDWLVGKPSSSFLPALGPCAPRKPYISVELPEAKP